MVSSYLELSPNLNSALLHFRFHSASDWAMHFGEMTEAVVAVILKGVLNATTIKISATIITMIATASGGQ